MSQMSGSISGRHTEGCLQARARARAGWEHDRYAWWALQGRSSIRPAGPARAGTVAALAGPAGLMDDQTLAPLPGGTPGWVMRHLTVHVWMTVTSCAVISFPPILMARRKRVSPPRKKKPSRPAAMFREGMTPGGGGGGGGGGAGGTSRSGRRKWRYGILSRPALAGTEASDEGAREALMQQLNRQCSSSSTACAGQKQCAPHLWSGPASGR